MLFTCHSVISDPQTHEVFVHMHVVFLQFKHSGFHHMPIISVFRCTRPSRRRRVTCQLRSSWCARATRLPPPSTRACWTQNTFSWTCPRRRTPQTPCVYSTIFSSWLCASCVYARMFVTWFVREGGEGPTTHKSLNAVSLLVFVFAQIRLPGRDDA